MEEKNTNTATQKKGKSSIIKNICRRCRWRWWCRLFHIPPLTVSTTTLAVPCSSISIARTTSRKLKVAPTFRRSCWQRSHAILHSNFHMFHTHNPHTHTKKNGSICFVLLFFKVFIFAGCLVWTQQQQQWQHRLWQYDIFESIVE